MARSGLARSFLISVVLASMVTVSAGTAGGSSPPAGGAPASGTYFGAYVQPEDWSRAGQQASVTNIEADLGRKLDIDHLFYKWEGDFTGWRQAWDLQEGRIPMVSWRGTYLDQILNGSQDAWIRSRADGLRSLGGPVLLRWFGEMDADIYAGNEIRSPSQFVAAWRRLHDVFVARGATNVEWVWCPNAYAFTTGEAQQYYPGDAYVDWLCADGYNWAPARAGSHWNPFKNIFSTFYAWAAPKSQPLMIGEVGVLENNPGDKAAWVDDMRNTIRNDYPEIKALVYFDAYSTANFGGWYDWRVDTSTSSYNAFKAMAADPFFNPGPGTPAPDAAPPTAPSGLQASPLSGTSVSLTWGASADDVGVAAYDVVRDQAVIASTSSTSYVDAAASPGTTYRYTVVARDASGNVSTPSTAVTVSTPPAGATAIFTDDFESGGLSAWTRPSGLIVRGDAAREGSWGAVARSTGSALSFGTTYLPSSYAELSTRTWFKVVSQATTVNLLRFQSPSGAGVLTLFVSSSGDLMLRNDVRATNVWSPTKVSRGAWHQVQIRVKVAGSASVTEVWYDGQAVARLSRTVDLGSAPIGRLTLGDNVSHRTYEVHFDDLAVDTGLIT